MNQIQTWRNQLKDNMVSLFDSGVDQRKDHDEQIKLLQAKIGHLHYTKIKYMTQYRSK